MTAPARTGGSVPPKSTKTAKARTAVPPRERTAAQQTERTARARTAAAERAYARRAQRTQRASGARPEPRERRQSGSASRVSFVIGVMSLLVAGVVATLWLATQATADAYKLEQARQNTSSLTLQVQNLQQQNADANSPPSLSGAAQRLGMVPAPEPAHIVVGPDGRTTVIGTPSAAAPPPATGTSTPPTTTAGG